MTNLVGLIEDDYKQFIKAKIPRKKFAIASGVTISILYGATSSLARLFPESFPWVQHIPGFKDYANMDTLEYIKLSVQYYPLVALSFVASGALTPEYYKFSTWIMFKPLKLIGRGIDYISNQWNRSDTN